jgi:hypothetical protein
MICTVMEAWRGGLSHSQMLHSWGEPSPPPAISSCCIVYSICAQNTVITDETEDLRAETKWRLAHSELMKLQQKVHDLDCKEACPAGAAQLRASDNSRCWYI